MTEEKNQPVKKVRCGRISISLWRSKSDSTNGATADLQRVCVQHSRNDINTGRWQNQHIWLNVDELRDLANAIDQLGEAGDESPSSGAGSASQDPASIPQHKGIER